MTLLLVRITIVIQPQMFKKQPGCDVDHSPPSNTEVKKCIVLYLLLSYRPSSHGHALYYFFYELTLLLVRITIVIQLQILKNMTMGTLF
jgi:hypothetical protein